MFESWWTRRGSHNMLLRARIDKMSQSQTSKPQHVDILWMEMQESQLNSLNYSNLTMKSLRFIKRRFSLMPTTTFLLFGLFRNVSSALLVVWFFFSILWRIYDDIRSLCLLLYLFSSRHLHNHKVKRET